jgi:ACS family tartrate transporter-like MFS transporter
VKTDFSSLSEIQLGFVNGLPFAAAIVAMLIVGWSSDHFHERVWHLVIPLIVAGVALYLTAVFGVMSGYSCLIIATMGIFASDAVFWAMAPEFLVGSGAVAGFALINSIAAVGGLIGPYTVGALVEHHGIPPALIFVAGAMFVSAVLAFIIARRITRQIRLGDLAS